MTRYSVIVFLPFGIPYAIFYDRNHRNIAFIGAEQEGRYRGYLEGLRLCGLPPCPEHLVQINTLSMDGGLQGMKQLLSQNRNITAVI